MIQCCGGCKPSLDQKSLVFLCYTVSYSKFNVCRSLVYAMRDSYIVMCQGLKME